MDFIVEYLRGLGYNVEKDYYGYINTWWEWYSGKVKKFHHYINHIFL